MSIDSINNLDFIGIETVKEHFSLTALQIQQFTALGELYRDWNAKINVISRKDIDNLYPHHIPEDTIAQIAFQSPYLFYHLM